MEDQREKVIRSCESEERKKEKINKEKMREAGIAM